MPPKTGSPQVVILFEVGRTDEIYARAIELAYGPSRRQARLQLVLNVLYYGTLVLLVGWIFWMVIDCEVPVQTGTREIINPGKQVHQGTRLLVQSSRRRLRSCELTRRSSIINGDGRRYDYEPDRFDAYGPVTGTTGHADVETTGPIIPLDAVPGRGSWISVLAWDCNMLQRALGWSIVQVMPPLDFEILRREHNP
ncbi:hypothetical protein CIW48_08965 [Methylobacterium sp. P1-11]|uniref:hypothetical protein n=1 Tax=Methylobacterium sp. P1-11 TaxID=2024616 RepID=UPI0011ECA685|nr:hypothetical protein [Methylobacterium sp. P1-11]KAA0124021.1 hypothetical protein CIW48_08965 [Methylobacterium sp. P1-11]